MKWYEKYLSVYGKPYADVPAEVMDGIRNRLRTLQSDEPLVSVVVIAYNEEKHLPACLWSLSESVCEYPMEIIGVNNDSADRTADVFEASGIPYHTELQHSCGYARRCGLQYAQGKYYICIDSDTMYPPGYVQAMADALQRPGIVAVSSLWSYMPDEGHPWLGLKIYEFMRDTHLWMQSFKRPELSVRGLVFAYNADYGRKVGYRVDIIRGEDGSMALGLKQYGRIGFVRSRKARAVTGYGTVGADGSFLNSSRVRIVKYLKGMGSYFTKKDRYRDDESNLVR